MPYLVQSRRSLPIKTQASARVQKPPPARALRAMPPLPSTPSSGGVRLSAVQRHRTMMLDQQRSESEKLVRALSARGVRVGEATVQRAGADGSGLSGVTGVCKIHFLFSLLVRKSQSYAPYRSRPRLLRRRDDEDEAPPAPLRQYYLCTRFLRE